VKTCYPSSLSPGATEFPRQPRFPWDESRDFAVGRLAQSAVSRTQAPGVLGQEWLSHSAVEPQFPLLPSAHRKA